VFVLHELRGSGVVLWRPLALRSLISQHLLSDQYHAIERYCLASWANGLGLHSTWLCALKRQQGQFRPNQQRKVSTSRGYLDRKPGYLQGDKSKANTALLTDNTRMTMHKKEKQNSFDRYPLLSWLFWCHFRVYHISTGCPFPFFLIFFLFSLSYEGRWSFGSRSLDPACFLFLGRVWLTELVDTNCNSMTMHVFTSIVPHFSRQIRWLSDLRLLGLWREMSLSQSGGS
jgi:hypothetical protein